MAEFFDLIVIGGGAAGLSAGQYGARANLKTLVLEGVALGGQAILISELENYPALPTVSGYQFAIDMQKQAEAFGAVIRQENVEKITPIKHEGKPAFTIKTTEGEYGAWAVVIATGSQHRHLEVPGEEALSGRGVSYCATCDGPFFKKKRILVVGGGDAACDEAMFLAKLTDQLTIVHRKDRFRAQASVAQRVLNHPSIKVRFNTKVVEIKGEKKVSSVLLENVETGARSEEEFDAVFIFVGSIPHTELVREGALSPAVACDDQGNIITNEKMATSVPGIFAAGDVRVTPFRQVITAAADGGVAAHCAALYIDEIHGTSYS